MIRNIAILSAVLLCSSGPIYAQTYNPTASNYNGNTAGGTNTLHPAGGNNNTAFGLNAGFGMGGGANTAIGVGALEMSGLSNNNTAVGMGACSKKTSGHNNVCLGKDAGKFNTTGLENVFVGASAGTLSKGSRNIMIGYRAGAFQTNGGTDNIYIGNEGLAENKTTRIGTPAKQTRTFISGIAGVPVTGSQVMINSSGQLGILASSQRYKKDIKPISNSGGIYKLRPVTYHYKYDKNEQPQYGLIAEEVERVYPDIVIKTDKGAPETVMYNALIPMLLKEIQQQHQMIKTLYERLDQLEARTSPVHASR